MLISLPVGNQNLVYHWSQSSTVVYLSFKLIYCIRLSLSPDYFISAPYSSALKFFGQIVRLSNVAFSNIAFSIPIQFRFAPRRFAFLKFAPSMSEPSRFVLRRFAFSNNVEITEHLTKFVFDKSTSLKSATIRFVDSKVHPLEKRHWYNHKHHLSSWLPN